MGGSKLSLSPSLHGAGPQTPCPAPVHAVYLLRCSEQGEFQVRASGLAPESTGTALLIIITVCHPVSLLPFAFASWHLLPYSICYPISWASLKWSCSLLPSVSFESSDSMTCDSLEDLHSPAASSSPSNQSLFRGVLGPGE